MHLCAHAWVCTGLGLCGLLVRWPGNRINAGRRAVLALPRLPTLLRWSCAGPASSPDPPHHHQRRIVTASPSALTTFFTATSPEAEVLLM